MPDGGGHDGASAQASPSAEVDAVALFEHLREEIRRGGAGPEGARATWRAQAERMWPVSAERPLQRRPGVKGAVAYPVKRLLRPLLRWYVEPLAAEQRAFNDAVLKLVDDLYEAADRARAGDESSRRALVELEERLRRVERRGLAGGAPPVAATVAAQPAATAVPDYFAFEARMRGSTAAVRERQRPYVEDFREAGPVLDIGCGRGEFLSLLHEAGVEARGNRRRRGHGRICARGGARGRAGRRRRLPRGARRRFARRCLRRAGCRALAARDARTAARAHGGQAPAGRPSGRRDDQPAFAARAAQLLRRSHACAAARPETLVLLARAGRLPRRRRQIPERARGAAGGARRPARSPGTCAG